MARNHPFEFSDDDDVAGPSGISRIEDAELSESGSAELHGMGQDLMGDAAATQQGSQRTERSAQKTAQKAATRSSTSQSETPTSMRHKRGNQPR